MRKTVFLLLIITIPLAVKAQITHDYEYTPLQADYESESFFYQPSDMTPEYLGSFNHLQPGFLDNPLNRIAQNPAWLPDLNGKDLYAYAEVHSRNTYKGYKNQNYYNPCPYCYYIQNSSANQSNFIWVPAVYNPYVNADGNRLDQKPLVSAAIVGYPFDNKRIFAGITYRAVVSKNDYYAYPSYSYPRGTSASNFTAGSVSPADYFNGSSLKQTGHFLTLNGGYRLNDRVVLGFKIGATLFKRDGGYGNPVNNPGFIVGYTPAPSISDLLTEQRSQHYRSLDFDLGTEYAMNSRLTAMIHMGYLLGSGDENLNTTIPSFFENGTPDTAAYYYMNESMSTYLDHWSNHGHTFYGGISLLYRLSSSSRLRFFYEGSGNGTGLNPDARSVTSTYTINQNAIRANMQRTTTDLQSSMLHSGTGREGIWHHQIGIFYEWKPVWSLTLNFGVQYGHYNRNTHTHESSLISGSTITQFTDTTGVTTTTTQPLNRSSQINWQNHIRDFSLQIPFMAQFRVFNKFTVWGGLNEWIERYKAKDNYFNPDPNPYSVIIAFQNSATGLTPTYYHYRVMRYRLTVMTGIKYDINNRITLHLMALPLDHRYSFNKAIQTSGLIWQAGVSIYP